MSKPAFKGAAVPFAKKAASGPGMLAGKVKAPPAKKAPAKKAR